MNGREQKSGTAHQDETPDEPAVTEVEAQIAPARDHFAEAVAQAYQTPPASTDFRARLGVLAAAHDTRTEADRAETARERATAKAMLETSSVVASASGREAARDQVTGWRGVVSFNWATAGLAGAVAAVAAGVYLTTATPRQAVAREALITRVTAATAKAETLHIRQWHPFNGEERTDRNLYYSASVGKTGAWLVRAELDWMLGGEMGYTTLQRDGKIYFHSHKQNRVEVSDTDSPLPPVTPAERLSRLREAGLLDRVTLLPDAPMAGRPAKRLRIELPPTQPNTEPGFYPVACPLRATIGVDPETGLPFQTVTEALYKEEWRRVRVEDATYNEPIEPALFSTAFPGATVITPEIEAKQANKKLYEMLAKNKHVVRAGDYSITLRGTDGTEVGDVYIFYSVPPGSPLPRVSMRDNSPRTWAYQGGGMVGRTLPELAPKWTFPDGERLCIAWFRNENPFREGGGMDWKVRFTVSGPGGGTSAEVSPSSGRMCGGPIPREDPYREILKENAPHVAAACRARAAAFADGRWKADAGLLRVAMQGEYSPRAAQKQWEDEARKVEARDR